MAAFYYYLALALQITGFVSVSLCLYSGILQGDYGKLETVQLIGGGLFFYVGAFMRNKVSSS